MRRILALISVVTVATVVVPALPVAAVPVTSDVPACAAYAGPWWPGWDIARGVALSAPTGGGTPTGGYVVDGFGGLHPFRWIAGAPPAMPTGGPWWPGWDIARGVATMPDGRGGYVVDGWGGIHPFAVDGQSPPPIVASAYWPGWDIVRGIAIQADGHGGYVLDAFGGQHPFTIGGIAPPAVAPNAAPPYRPGVDWARGLARPFVAHTDTGVVIDGTGVMTGFGSAKQLVDWAGPSWPGWNIARGIAASDTGDTCALVVDGFGGLHLAWPDWTSAPAPVTTVDAGSGGGSGEVAVWWRSSARATGFRVQRATAAGGPFTTTADYDVASDTATKTAGAMSVTYTETDGFTYIDVPGSGPHYYRVVASNAVGAAPASVVVCGSPVGAPAC